MIAPSTTRIRPNSARRAGRPRLRCLCSSSSVKTGTKARGQRGVGHERAQQVRDLERDREGRERDRSCRSSSTATISRTGPAIRERPVAIEKIAVLTAIRRAGAGRLGRPSGRAIVRAPPRPDRGVLTSWPTSTHRRSASSAPSASGSRIAATRRDQDVLPPPRGRRRPAATTTPPTPSTASWSALIDKAVKRGALHRNNGARKKSRAPSGCAAASPPSPSDVPGTEGEGRTPRGASTTLPVVEAVNGILAGGRVRSPDPAAVDVRRLLARTPTEPPPAPPAPPACPRRGRPGSPRLRGSRARGRP